MISMYTKRFILLIAIVLTIAISGFSQTVDPFESPDRIPDFNGIRERGPDASGSLLPVSPAMDSLNMKTIGRWGYGRCYDVELVGQIAFFGNGGYLEIMDFSNPASPGLLSRILLPSPVFGTALIGNYLYVAADKSGLLVIDVSNPSSPRMIGQCVTGGYGRSVTVSGVYAYLADYHNGMQVIDISSPSNPHVVGSIGTNDYTLDVIIEGNYAYMADRNAGLRIINISNPANPQEMSSYDTPGRANAIDISNNYAFVADGGQGLRIIDISNPSSPQETGYYVFDSPTNINGLTVNGNYAYLADSQIGMRVIDVSNPASPVPLGSYDIFDAYRVVVSGSTVYVAGLSRGLWLLDVSDPNHPQYIYQYDTSDGSIGIAVKNNYAYIATAYDGLTVIDISDPTNPVLTGTIDTKGYANDLVLLGSYAYIADKSGLCIIDITNPASLIEMAYLDMGGNVYDLVISGNYAYIATVQNGLEFVDISNPSNPQWIGGFDTQGETYGIAVTLNYAYLADGSNGLIVLDVSSRTNPQQIGWLDTEETAMGVAVSGNYLYLTDGSNGLHVIDVSSPSAPVEVGSMATRNYADKLVLSGNTLYISDVRAGVLVVDISSPTNPQEMGYYETGYIVYDVTVNNQYVFCADWGDGLYILEYTEPEEPPPPQASLTLSQPTGSSSWEVGQSKEITWSSTGTISYVKVELSRNSGSSWEILVSSTSNDGSTSWTVTNPVSDNCRIRISSTGDASVFDESEGLFSITAQKITDLTCPSTQPSGSSQTAYRIISVPVDLDDSKASTQILDDLGTYDKSKWRMFDYQGGSWVEYSTSMRLTPGYGYFIIVNQTGKRLDVGSGALIGDDTYTISLSSGWNLVANPYNFDLASGDLSLGSGGVITLWSYKGSWNTATDFKSWEGYGLYASSATTLTVSPGWGSIGKKVPVDRWADAEWLVGIQARCEGALDDMNFCGVHSEAVFGYDALDLAEPPPIGEYIALYFNHEDWNENGGKFATDFRSGGDDGYIWDFTGETVIPDADVVLEFTDTENIPSGLKARLVDTETLCVQDLSRSKTYTFRSGKEGSVRKFQMLVGTKEYIQEQMHVPADYQLYQNYPNPFNPQTSVAFDLPEAVKVSVVIYNVKGEAVRSLIDNEDRGAGQHIVIWDGKNDRGERIASGIYLYSIITENGFSMIRKMTFLK